MRTIILSALLCFSSLIAVAQTSNVSVTNNHKKFTFHSINQIGILEGEAGTSFQLQTVNGVVYKRWSAGVGTGLDYYSFRTIPLFLEVRKPLLPKKNSPFVYAAGGYTYPWAKGNSSWYQSDYKKGYYYDTGIGYTITTKSSGAFVCSIGYSAKKFSEIRSNPIMIDIWPIPNPNITTYKYQLRRLSVTVGWMF